MEINADIHLRHLPYSAIKELTKKLEVSGPMIKDWRDLAERFGARSDDILLFEKMAGTQRKSCTEYVLEHYMGEESATVRKLQAALQDMNRQDAVQIVEDYRKQTEECYWDHKHKLQQMSRVGEENSYNWSNGEFMPQNPYPSCTHHREHFPKSFMYNRGVEHYAQPPSLMMRQNTYPGYSNPPHSGEHVHRHNSTPEHSYMCERGQDNTRYDGHDLRTVHPNPYFSSQFSPNVYHSESMVVHGEPTYGPMDQDEDTCETMQTDSPAPLPVTIMRGAAQYPSFNSTQSMGEVESLDIGRVEEVITSGSSVQFVPLQRPAGRPGYYSQGSESFRNGAVVRMTRSPPTGHLEKLQKLSQIPQEYQPNTEYKNVVAEQRVDDQLKTRYSHGKDEQGKITHCHGNSVDRLTPRGTSNSKDLPSHFPRVRSNTADGSIPSGKMSETKSLTKSTSLPVNMKPSEFRKSFRHIKVFVTYSNDNNNHLRKVLSLCNCLVKNGFSCCVDINNRYIATLANQEERTNWYQKKFSESDFILVCPSKKYKEEIHQKVNENKSAGDNQLHTQLIFQLMCQEYGTQGKNTRFVPVMFEGESKDLLPSWLQNVLAYSWPSQYKDLLWMLTRPEDRIKPKPKLFSESISQSKSSGLEVENSDVRS